MEVEALKEKGIEKQFVIKTMTRFFMHVEFEKRYDHSMSFFVTENSIFGAYGYRIDFEKKIRSEEIKEILDRLSSEIKTAVSKLLSETLRDRIKLTRRDTSLLIQYFGIN